MSAAPDSIEVILRLRASNRVLLKMAFTFETPDVLDLIARARQPIIEALRLLDPDHAGDPELLDHDQFLLHAEGAGVRLVEKIQGQSGSTN